MRKLLLISFFAVITLSSFSQGIKSDILMRVLPDHGWTLQLEENYSYKYVHSSGWGGGGTLDSGTYQLKGDTLVLTSQVADSLSKSYIMLKKKLNLKENWRVLDFIEASSNGQPRSFKRPRLKRLKFITSQWRMW